MRKKALIVILSVSLVCILYIASSYAADRIQSDGPSSNSNTASNDQASPYEVPDNMAASTGENYTGSASSKVSVTNSGSETTSSASVIITNNGKEEVSWHSNEPNSSYSTTISTPNNGNISVSIQNKSTGSGNSDVSVSSRSSNTAISTGSPSCPSSTSPSANGCGSTTTIPQPPNTQDTATAKEVSISVLGDVISPRNAGMLRVVVYGSPGFDASSIDQGSVRLAGAGAHRLRDPFVDLNEDDIKDAVLYFDTGSLNLQPCDTQVTLTGRTVCGQSFKGTATVRVLGLER